MYDTRDFDTLGDALAFFTDNPFDLGAMTDLAGSSSTLEIGLKTVMSTSDPNSGFYFGSLIGDGPAATPEVALFTGTTDPDTFHFNPDFGHATVAQFDTAADIVEFDSAVFADFAAVVAAAKDVDGSTVITADANDALIIQNVTVSQLNAGHFLFV